MTPASITYAYSILAQQKRRNRDTYELLCEDIDQQIMAAAKRGADETVIIIPDSMVASARKLISDLIQDGYEANFIDTYNLWISWENV